MGRVFANGLGDLGSIPDRVIPKTLKMVLDTSLLNTQQYKVHIKGKVEQSRERSGTFPYTSVSKLLKREPSGHPRPRSPTLLYVCECVCMHMNVLQWAYICMYKYMYILGFIHHVLHINGPILMGYIIIMYWYTQTPDLILLVVRVKRFQPL